MWWGTPQVPIAASTPGQPALGTDTAAQKRAREEEADVGLKKMETPGQTEDMINGVLFDRLQEMRGRGDLCDVVLVAPGGVESPVHGAVLSAVSGSFLRYLQWRDGVDAGKAEGDDPLEGTLMPVAVADGATARSCVKPLKLDVCGMKTSESVNLVLDYVYVCGTGGQWEYNPTSPDVNHDVLRLARRLQLERLHEIAARWLAKGLTTSNVVERLATCEELSLSQLRNRIIEQLAAVPKTLVEVAAGQEIMKHPLILQDLLVQVAMRTRDAMLRTAPSARAPAAPVSTAPTSGTLAPPVTRAPSASNHMPTKRAKRAGA